MAVSGYVTLTRGAPLASISSRALARTLFFAVVYTGVAAVEHGIEPGSDEHDALLNDLVSGGYLAPHTRASFRSQGVYRITLKGIDTAERD
jgi:hypothetical protein